MSLVILTRCLQFDKAFEYQKGDDMKAILKDIRAGWLPWSEIPAFLLWLLKPQAAEKATALAAPKAKAAA